MFLPSSCLLMESLGSGQGESEGSRGGSKVLLLMRCSSGAGLTEQTAACPTTAGHCVICPLIRLHPVLSREKLCFVPVLHSGQDSVDR